MFTIGCNLLFFRIFYASNDNAIATEVFCMTQDVAGSTQMAPHKLFIQNIFHAAIAAAGRLRQTSL
ncbi:hypothetical protein [Herbaspirillum sp. CF444]|uniref:hypothetical protein n=1 Tax=Herbaspirillum sp. CF444 TaxID=1144319 RepID=UPI000554892B|nr:hypothetical protein [Herbaspirillum sp. CF444]